MTTKMYYKYFISNAYNILNDNVKIVEVKILEGSCIDVYSISPIKHIGMGAIDSKSCGARDELVRFYNGIRISHIHYLKRKTASKL